MNTWFLFLMINVFSFITFSVWFFPRKSGAISAVFGYTALGFPNRKLLTIPIIVEDQLSVDVTAFEVKIMVY